MRHLRTVIGCVVLLAMVTGAAWILRQESTGYTMTEQGAEAYLRVEHEVSDYRGGEANVHLIRHPQDENVAFAVYTISGYAGSPFAYSYFLRWRENEWELNQPPLLKNGTIGIFSEFGYAIAVRSFACDANACWLEISAANDTHGMGHVSTWQYNPTLRSRDNGDSWQWWHSEREIWVDDPRELWN